MKCEVAVSDAKLRFLNEKVLDSRVADKENAASLWRDSRAAKGIRL